MARVIYHMCERPRWEQALRSGTEYFPPTYDKDGFIHATEDPAMLLGIANHFYKDSKDEWICLRIDTGKIMHVFTVREGRGAHWFALPRRCAQLATQI